jgi:outer membrane protein OmpA-like peptidoglycan-associated protein/tetratricopeptide (TPR) repeat protein
MTMKLTRMKMLAGSRLGFLLILIFLGTITGFAQKSQADKKFMLYEYSEAIPLYKQYLENNPDDYDAARKLALSYKYMNNISGSIEAYQSLLRLKEAVPEDWFELVQLLRINRNLPDARLYALQYQQKNNGEKAQNLLRSLDLYDELMAGMNEYDVVNRTGQYNQSVFSPIVYQNGLLITAENPDGARNQWTGRGNTKLFLTDLTISKLVPFAGELMSKYNDGPATLSKDGKALYFTTINKKSVQEQDINTSKLQISAAVLTGSKWQFTDGFRFNNPAYNVAHPALRSDGTLLVFASDKPGGKGGMDLYYCLKQPDDTWSEPINLSVLNSSENEIFPTFDAAYNLYYSSNGLPGLGGLDLFISKNEGDTFSEPVNLKAPINSSFDDFFLTTNNDLESGYLSTNRFGTPETDDIAAFSRKVALVEPVVEPVANPVIQITVLDKYTSIPLPYVSVTLKDEKNNIVFQGMTDPEGKLLVEEMPADTYRVQGILNEVTTTLGKIGKEDFTKELIERTLTHNDPRFTLSGIATNATTGQPVAGVTVTCENTVLNKTNSRTTGSDGTFFFQLEQASDFKVMGEMKGWLSSEAIYETTKGLDRSKDLYVLIKLNMQQPAPDEVIRLDKIYYDYDKCDIKPRAAEELNRLIKLMNDYTDMIIELSSHTDSRGTNEYNQKLSQCRADAAVGYILGKGIGKDRIMAIGYGESRLVNGCADGVTCTEQQHQENRRTEFKILSCSSCPKIEK